MVVLIVLIVDVDEAGVASTAIQYEVLLPEVV